MKLRIRENTIRLRLKKAEVDRLAAGQAIVEKTVFPDSVLTYRLDIASDGKFSASFHDGSLAVCLPEQEVTQWAQNDQVSIVAEQALRNAGTLSLLIEKDFQCLAPGHNRPGEDDIDTYPHPDAQSCG